MSSPARIEVVLPAILAFVFGLGSGVVVSRAVWGHAQPTPVAGEGEGMADSGVPPGPGDMSGGGGAAGMPGGADAGDVPGGESSEKEPDEATLKQRLELHEQLLAKNPDDVRLLQTVGNYLALLHRGDEAMVKYERAEALARTKGETAQLAQVLVDEAVAHAELEDYPKAFGLLDDATKADPADVRSRLTAAAIYLTRIMPSPKTSMEDRRHAVSRSDELIKEVLAIDPQEPHALQFKGWMDQVRASMGRGGAPGGAGAGMPGAVTPQGTAMPAAGASGP